MKQPETWFVIADGQRARIVRRLRTPRARVEDVFPYQWVNSELLSVDIDNEGLGRGSAPADTATFHTIQPGPDPRRQLKQEFAVELAEFLNRGAQAKHFNRLVLIAAPKTLGDIRGALSDTARNCIVAEIDKDLTHAADDDLALRFEELMP
ncbi:host attachment protein [Pedomonas mirosovicensis]|uniref:host attachment protein n=1 Tax=Pedomonas mirosovicensis TaxID=2908641 RepID=UPI0021670966|nr:host attachment protein [Pedomonas mirosovicensis]MCH8685757.1 host attachment protein [Pedomonas mirosovicensis]